MKDVRRSPGHAAAGAFRLGMVCAAVCGLSVFGLYWATTSIEPHVAGAAFLATYPVYLLVAAAVLSRWLGYTKDTSALRRVTRPRNAD